MANSIDPDLMLIWVYTVSKDLSVQILRVITEYKIPSDTQQTLQVKDQTFWFEVMVVWEKNEIKWKYGKYPKNSNTKGSDKMIYANSVDPDQTAPEGAVWSESTLFAIPLNI